MIAMATLYLRIPGPTGYYHLGDGLIYAAAILLGPGVAAAAAAVGSALADVMGGYAVWALPTFIIKGLTALAIGTLAYRARAHSRVIAAMAVGALITIVGYSLVSYFVFGMAFALTELYGNLGQTASGMVIGWILVTVFRRLAPFSD